jgi:putative transposase
MRLIKKSEQPENKGYALTRRRRPHYEIPGRTYFCTTNASSGKIFREDERDTILASIHFLAGQDFTLFACVVMPDHIHLLIRPNMVGDSEAITLEQIFHRLKSFTAHKIAKGPRGHVWQPERDDHLIRDSKEYFYCKQYIIENPVVAGLVEKPDDYRWLYFRDDIGM